MKIKNKSMIPSLSSLIYAAGFALALTAAVSADAASDTAAASQPLPRIDVPVTPANSVLYDFGDGVFLRVPKILFPEAMIPKDPKLPIKLDRFSMVFQYPDMVQSSYPSAMERIFEQQAGRDVPKPDGFTVRVKWLFISHEVLRSDGVWITPNAKWDPDPRPMSMLRRLEQLVLEDAKLHNLPDAKVTFIDAKYPGLREVQVPVTDKEYKERSEKMWRKSGWDGKKGAQYIEKLGSPYELFMRCQAPDSLKCDAYVYIKNSHFQYAMVFPPNQVEHADKLIKTINKMIDGWIQK